MKTDQMKTLRLLIAKDLKEPFPKSVNDEELGKLHDELIQYDSYIMGLLISAANHDKSIQRKQIYKMPVLLNEIEKFITTSEDKSNIQIAESYLNRLNELHRFVDFYLQSISQKK